MLQVHALHNLLLIGTNLPDETKEKYSNDMKRFEENYLKNNVILVGKKMIDWQKCVQEVKSLKKELRRSEYTWWAAILAHERKNSAKLSDLIDKIIKEVSDKYDTTDLIGRNSDGISFILHLWIDKLNDERKNVFNCIKKLNYFINNLKPLSALNDETSEKIQKLVDEALECHLDPDDLRNTKNKKNEKNEKNKCDLCKAISQLDAYECVVFDKKIAIDENVEGTWQPSYQEAILKALFQATRRWDLKNETIEDGKTYLKMCEALRKEFKELSQLWVEVNFAVGAFDEINMCKSRLQAFDPVLIEEKEIKSKLCISKYDVEDTIIEFKQQMKDAEAEFVRKMGRLKYLNHLEKSKEVDNCPICSQPPENKYSVLECGHHLCLLCTVAWSEQTPGRNFLCPVCRHVQSKIS